ncbi:GAF domain-containing protein [Natronorarus salvus]|uniref:GAF domain-containing protein n=1 Tax=Natronorarus salvus TaxID=3117733 RepID=UPI002F260B3D
MFDDRSLSRIVEATDEGLFVVDPAHSLAYLNEAVAVLVGDERSELLGRDLSVLAERGVVSTATVRELRSAVDRIVEGEDRALSIERPITRDDREELDAAFDLRALAGDEGPIHVVVFVRDVGDRRAAEERLDAQSRRIERLHAGSTAMIACRDESEVYDLAVSVAEDVLAFELCSILVAEDGWLVPRAWSSATKPAGVRTMRTDEGLAGRTYTSGESRLVPVVERDPDADPASESYRSGVSVPIGGIGVFQAVATETHAFDERDVKLVELLMSTVAEAVARIRAESRLADERDRLAALFENVPEPVVSYEVGGDAVSVRAVNPAFERVFGFDPTAAPVEELNERFVPEGEESTATALDERMAAGEGYTAEVTRLAADGGREFLVHVVPTTDGRERGGFVIYTDITEGKRHERRLDDLHGVTRELMAAETHETVAGLALRAAREVLDLGLAAVYLYDEEREVLEPAAATAAATEMFAPLPEFGPGSGLAWRTFETGEPFVTPDIREYDGLYNPETEIRTELIFPFGEYGIGIAGSTEIGAFSESTVSLAGVLAANVEAALERADREATLRARERDLARQNERLSEFAGVVSHDLRNPLTVARGYLAMLDGEEEVVSRIEDAHRRMDALTDDLLSLAREGKVVGETESVSVADAAREAWSVVETADATLGVEVKSAVRADPDRLVELFANLYRNAVEHGGEDVTVSVSDAEGGFAVADDGPGIPPEERAVALDAGYTTGEDGTGLGLAIVNRIAEAHGWTVSLEESECGGTRVVFTVE